jgi:hypothetical protein
MTKNYMVRGVPYKGFYAQMKLNKLKNNKFASFSNHILNRQGLISGTSA